MSNALPRHAAGRHLSVWQDGPDPAAATAPARDDADGDATTAVVAHGLLGNLAVIRGVARLLIHEPDLADDERAKLLEMLDSQVDLLQGVLTDLIRGLPSHALAALDELRR